MKKYIYNVKVTIRHTDGESEPWELSDMGLRRKIVKLNWELRKLEASKIAAISSGNYEEAMMIRREQEYRRTKLYNLVLEEEFRLGH